MAEPLVGRTGADGAWVLLDSSPRHEAPVAHVRPFWQHPPPRLAGHENQPIEHMYAELNTGVDEGAGADDAGSDVGTTMTAVDEGGGGGEEEGWTYVIDVPAMAPKACQQ